MSDVCLFLEGTYPYVTGGVSSCVYQLIRSTPHLNYSILYIGSVPEDAEEYKYPIPANVQLIKNVFLFDYEIKGNPVELGAKFDLDLLKKFCWACVAARPMNLRRSMSMYFKTRQFLTQ